MPAPSRFRLGLVQMRCGTDPEANVERAVAGIRDAAGRGAQIVCLPELFRTQYFCQREDPALFDLAEPIPGPTSERMAAVAKELGVVVVASLFERRAAIADPRRSPARRLAVEYTRAAQADSNHVLSRPRAEGRSPIGFVELSF